jgi:hypothetical protein
VPKNAVPRVACLCEAMRLTCSPIIWIAPSCRKPEASRRCSLIVEASAKAIERDQSGNGVKQGKQRIKRDARSNQERLFAPSNRRLP